MKRCVFVLAVLLVAVGLMAANSKTTSKIEMSNDPITALERTRNLMPLLHNRAVDDIDTIFAHIAGLSADSLDKNYLTADTVSVSDSLYVGDDVEIGDVLTVTDSAYVDKLEVNTTANFTGATVTFDNNEISGDKVEGGTIAAITITTLTVGDSLYVTDDMEVEDNLFVDGEITADSAFVLDIEATVATLDSAQVNDLTVTVGTLDSLYSSNVEIAGGGITATNVTVGAGKTLNVSAGTLTLANDQISGDKVQGGTIGSTTITTLTSTDVVVGDSLFVDGILACDSLRVNPAGGVSTEAIDAADKYIWIDISGTRYKLMLKAE